ncbi:glycoside hydrolase [Jaminaea rosea]|uniref:glucan endo-1,3-beta-D-glucosidase n=1 Tax=Jaminaea rosea TaxID=1569628 RepID=A0A316UL72_9BASI|nr:glycoside hydrolase [Jaminaea rosea]PWN26017.1 glycoside hydrolase [Jaminaea rosea]
MSLPLGFSPFDDYDSPYASTNAAIRNRGRRESQTSPTSSFQQRRESHGSMTPAGGSTVGLAQQMSTPGQRTSAMGDVDLRRSEAPPEIPQAQDFGSRKFQRPSSQDGIRAIARPQPMGAQLASIAPSSPPSSPPQATSPASPQTSPVQRRPAPPPPARATSPPASPSVRPPVPMSPPRKAAPPPAQASIPEPAAPPAASYVQASTPAHEEEQPPRTNAAGPLAGAAAPAIATPFANEMTQTNRSFAPPIAEHAPSSPSDDGDDDIEVASSHHDEVPRRQATPPPHTAYDMGNAASSDHFAEKTPAAAIAAAAAGTGAAGSSWKVNNEGSRWSAGNDAPLLNARRGGGSGGSGGLARSYRNNKRKWWLGGGILLLVILIAAIVGGVVGGKSSSSSGSDNSSSDDGTSGNGRSKGNTGSSGSPDTTGPGGTKVQPDSRLHNSFYGINYEPFSTDPTAGCGANITGVMEDVKLLSQLTTRVRLGGSACNETALVLDAISRTKVDLTVWAAITLDLDGTGTTTFTDQVNNLTYAFNTFGTQHVSGVVVGEEYVTNGGSATTLIANLQRWRQVVTDNSAWGSLLTTTAEVTSVWTQALVNAVDIVFANNQAWYSEIAAEEAAGWAYGYAQDTVVPLATDSTPANKDVVQSEFGWPTGASTTAAATQGEAVASVANLQTVLDTYVCASNTNGSAYFWYELFDFVSSSRTDGVAPFWGLFDANKQLKTGITIPDCSHR